MKESSAIAHALMTALEPGKLLDRRYRIVKTLAKGGFGRTYIAEDMRRPGNPQCVVKHLKPASHDSGFLEHARRLFATEAETLEKLGHHDQIPRLLAYFEEDQEFYLVQDLIDGHTLSQELQSDQTWSSNQIWQMLQDVLSILIFVHEYGVIHRDIKPDNIIRRRHDGKLVLVDFGAVKQIQSHPARGHTSTIAVGTPGYMPTEQSNGKPRPNSDIYALGIIGIQAATGLSPNKLQEDADTGEVLWSSDAIHDELAAILSRMVRYHFKDRYQSAAEALRAIEQLLSNYPDLDTEIRYSSIALKAEPRYNIQAVPGSHPPVLSLPKLTEALSSLEDTLAAPSEAAPLLDKTPDSPPMAVEGIAPVAIEEAIQTPPVTELLPVATVEPLITETDEHTETNELTQFERQIDSEDDLADEPPHSTAEEIERSPQIRPTHPPEPQDESLPLNASPVESPTVPSTILDLVPDGRVADDDRTSVPDGIVVVEGDRTLAVTNSLPPNRAAPPIQLPHLQFPLWKALLGIGLVASVLALGIPAMMQALFFVNRSSSPSRLAQAPLSQVLVLGVPCPAITPVSLTDRKPDLRLQSAIPADYYGSVHAGKPTDGKGSAVFPNGDRFDGEFRNGMFNGCGTVTFANNYIKTYIGQFQNGLYAGLGVLTWTNGDRYIGQFEKGKCQGEGTFISKKYHQSISGTWENGDLPGSDLSCNKVNK